VKEISKSNAKEIVENLIALKEIESQILAAAKMGLTYTKVEINNVSKDEYTQIGSYLEMCGYSFTPFNDYRCAFIGWKYE